MARIVGIVGPSGSGKSTALRKLDPKKTYLISILDKLPPFKGSETSYNVENRNYFSSDNYQQISEALKLISEKRPEVECIVIDDVGFVMQTEFFNRATEKGYDKFSEIGQHMFKILNTCRHIRDNITVFLLFHAEDIISGQVIVGSKIKTIGRMLDDKYDPQALTSICLYTHIEDNKGTPTYHFVTNKWDVYPAKSPMNMFDNILIPNDLNLVLETIKEYYK